ncbi:myrosinase 1-like [Aricia agestis]|uniref:myrosinase 1-like n=1 Tax=Aricia agestis TaxID=91739 RepID=UPI001C206762|nr:myrosinase 1-like [Aricia agestis]
MKYYVVLLSVLIERTWSTNDAPQQLKFPPWFKFGAATAAHQIEGAWNVSDKTPSVWDVFSHEKPSRIGDGSNGDVACDSYHLWREDIEMVTHLGLHFYRFSISWPRLLPSGFPDRISSAGRRYYSELIDGLLAAGVEPVVTVYHWDLPQSLQDLGGWTNPLVVDWFADYARVVFSLFADRVKTWITINEPLVFCDGAYTMGVYAPGVLSPDIGKYLCNRHALLAHAKAWRIYDQEFRDRYRGKISLANTITWYEPADGETDDVAEIVRQYGGGIFSHPIFSKKGGWPPVIAKMIAENSRRQGYPKSRLPPFTEKEIKFIRGTYDFYALNYYTSRVVRRARPGETIDAWPFFGAPELNVSLTVRPEWKKAPPSWFYINPVGIRHQIRWLKEQYGDVEVLIAENGYASHDPTAHDMDRVQFYKDHLEQVLLSIYEDGVNVTGFTAWSLMDNYEWMDGYVPKFGLFAVDFNDQRTRSPRTSASYYAAIIREHALIEPPEYLSVTQNATNTNTSYNSLILSFVLIVYFIK